MTARSELPEEAFAVALASTPHMGPATLRRLLSRDMPSVAWQRGHFGDDHEVLDAWQRHEELDLTVLIRQSDGYPVRLQADPDAPAVLFCRGDPGALSGRPTVALVGTRSPTRYGIGVAAQLGSELSAAGVSVVSGLALGIDGAAHEGACAAGSPPIAVVAGGLESPYPSRHERLWERVAASGVMVSESPVGVGTEKWRFPVRNRLLAALSDVVVVVESRRGGGSHHTVEAASARGIPVGAVPGSIRSPTSAGTNALLSDGCFPVCDVSDILIALSLNGAPVQIPPRQDDQVRRGRRPATPEPAPGSDEAMALAALSPDPTGLDELVRLTGLDLPALCGALERLARAGRARDVGGWWEGT